MKKKPVASKDEEPEPEVFKVVRRVSIMNAQTMSDLEQQINDFLEMLNYNDITEPAVELYFFYEIYYAKVEYDLRIKK